MAGITNKLAALMVVHTLTRQAAYSSSSCCAYVAASMKNKKRGSCDFAQDDEVQESAG